MLSINTNLSSLIAQNSMSSATNLLNQAVERMTTGYKINHSKDNAANYSISEKMNMQISSFDVAADNVAMGMDLVTTASDIISNMQDKASRLQALCTQARNGTYGGGKSLLAINAEANSLIAEINRLYNTAEYNNVSLFNQKAYEIADHLPKAGASGFIDETGLIATASVNSEYGNFIADPKTYTDEEVAAMTRVKDVSTFSSGQKYAIYSKEELQKLADYVNAGNDTTGVEFVLGADIDLSSISNWTPIGDYSTNTNYQFKGTFDGNGHVIKNLTIDNETKDYQGLFGCTASGSIIKNVALEGGSIKGKRCTGGLVGYSYSTISNSYATGAVSGTGYVGGLVGISESSISNSYATGAVSGTSDVGGLVGDSSSSISNSYATGNVTGSSGYVGGLVGDSSSSISNSYATGAVTGTTEVGGLVGDSSSSISNSYATGNVTGSSSRVGGLVGNSYSSSISNSYATGNVTGTSSQVGGLVGRSYSTISNSYATGAVSGTYEVGGLVGFSESSSISNSYATGNVTGTSYRVGGLVGLAYSDTISNSYATGAVTGTLAVGGLVGDSNSYFINNSYATGTVSGDSFVGGLVGRVYKTSDTMDITDSTSYGTATGNDKVGSFIGAIIITSDNTSFGTVNITNCSAISQNVDMISGCYTSASGNPAATYDMTAMLAGISAVTSKSPQTTLQVGINSDSSNQISFDMNFELNFDSLGDLTSDEALASIMSFQTLLSDKATALGAIENRLQSAIESIEVNIENLTSSLSTIRDADIAEVSSEYIRQQILQQASATLLSTANQSPSIALQLI